MSSNGNSDKIVTVTAGYAKRLSASQTKKLLFFFENVSMYPTNKEKHQLSKETGVCINQVWNWFNNKKAANAKLVRSKREEQLKEKYRRELKEDLEEQSATKKLSNATFGVPMLPPTNQYPICATPLPVIPQEPPFIDLDSFLALLNGPTGPTTVSPADSSLSTNWTSLSGGRGAASTSVSPAASTLSPNWNSLVAPLTPSPQSAFSPYKRPEIQPNASTLVMGNFMVTLKPAVAQSPMVTSWNTSQKLLSPLMTVMPSPVAASAPISNPSPSMTLKMWTLPSIQIVLNTPTTLIPINITPASTSAPSAPLQAFLVTYNF